MALHSPKCFNIAQNKLFITVLIVYSCTYIESILNFVEIDFVLFGNLSSCADYNVWSADVFIAARGIAGMAVPAVPMLLLFLITSNEKYDKFFMRLSKS